MCGKIARLTIETPSTLTRSVVCSRSERHIERRTGPGDPGIVDQHIDLLETKMLSAGRPVRRLGSTGQPTRIQHFLYREGAVLREVTLG